MSEDLDPSSEFDRVVGSFVKETNNEAEALKQKQQQQMHKCVNDAEAAAVAMLRQHKASAGGESTNPPVATPSEPSIATADSTSNNKEGEGGEDLLGGDQSIPQTHQEAMEQLNRLKTMRDSLLEEKSRNDKFVSRYQEKVAKAERMAELHNLIPRQLFVREDRYQQELEHVYKWSGISDQEIADIYLAKLKKSGNIKQHGASTVMRQQNRDPYAHMKFPVPDFYTASVDQQNKNNSSNVLRNLDLMRRIAGNNN